MTEMQLQGYRPRLRPRGAETDPNAPDMAGGERAHNGDWPADPARAQDAPPRRRPWLFNPWVDFLTLGGGSLVALAALAAFYPEDETSLAVLGGFMLFIAHFVNHPHFAHSYQLFYRGFAKKAFSPDAPLAARYRFAGIMVPAALAAFLLAALALGSTPLLGLAANAMFFTVGWHYAKQGYGILMLDAARKGFRFDAGQRRRLLWNTHLIWIANWLFANDVLKEKDLWGITYYLLDLPDPILYAVAGLATLSTLAVGRDLFVKWRGGSVLPVNGLLAYVAAVYVWLIFVRFDPVLLFVIPMFHSLQYMAVVWRYQLNVEGERLQERPRSDGTRWTAWLRTAPAGLVRFVLVAGVLGYLGFWLAPIVLDTVTGYDRALFGTTLFLFLGWTFINIHHYFIDNVIWRRDNPGTRRHLFAA